MKKIAPLLIALLAATAARPIDLPDWFVHPPDDPLSLYAFGISDPGLSPEKAREQATGRAGATLALLYRSKTQRMMQSYSEISEGEIRSESITSTAKLTVDLAEHPSVEVLKGLTLPDGSLAVLARASLAGSPVADSTRAFITYYSQYIQSAETGDQPRIEEQLQYAYQDPQRQDLVELASADQSTQVSSAYHSAAHPDTAVSLWEVSGKPFFLDQSGSFTGETPVALDPESVHAYGYAQIPTEVESPFAVYLTGLASALFHLSEVVEGEKAHIQEELFGDAEFAAKTSRTDGESGDAELFSVVAKTVTTIHLEHVRLAYQQLVRQEGMWESRLALAYPRGAVYRMVLDELEANPDALKRARGTRGMATLRERANAFAAPFLSITEPALVRGLKMVQGTKTATVRGVAWSRDGIFEVRVNDGEAALGADGEFTARVKLAVGRNEVTVRAVDLKERTAEQTFSILREADAAFDPSTSASPQFALAATGTYHALLIGVQDYAHPSVQDLDFPLGDARRMRDLLIRQYDFAPGNVTLLENPDRATIIGTFAALRRKVAPDDNLLIFFAGHGYWDEELEQGYWLPADAARDNPAAWLSNSTVRDYIRGIKSRHTLLVADACFSGGIFKSRSAFFEAAPSVQELYKLPSRKAMTSGTLKEVPDRSVFVRYLLKRLEENDRPFVSAEELFASFRTAVINNSPVRQVPQYGEIREAGDEGGDFIFVRRP